MTALEALNAYAAEVYKAEVALQKSQPSMAAGLAMMKATGARTIAEAYHYEARRIVNARTA
jgi:hypothetical protein